MSLLSTILAFALVPLVKRNEKEGKEQIAFLEAEVASYKEINKTLAAHLTAERRDVSILNTTLAAERERGRLDREQTRYWRSQADYWQQAYTSLAVPNQFSPNRQIIPEPAAQELERYQQYSQAAQTFHTGQGLAQLGGQAQAQQLTAQQLALSQQPQQLGQQNWQPDYQSVGWLDCTCVPGRAEALLRAQPGDIIREAQRLMAAPFRSMTGE